MRLKVEAVKFHQSIKKFIEFSKLVTVTFNKSVNRIKLSVCLNKRTLPRKRNGGVKV